MAQFKQGDNVDQGFLLPLSMRDWLLEDHLAWFIMDAADALNVDVLLGSYRASGKGALPYKADGAARADLRLRDRCVLVPADREAAAR